MDEINLWIRLTENLYISPQEYFLVFFAILGIIATVLSIATSLTKEQRQDVLLNYFFKSKSVLSYLGFLIVSFFIPFILFLTYPTSIGLEFSISILLMINFGLIFWFVFYVIKSLSRKSIYKKIFNDFREETK